MNKVLVVGTRLFGPRVEVGQSQGTRVAATLLFYFSSNQAFISWLLETNTENSNETLEEIQVSKHKIFWRTIEAKW